jgi:hypothetical protein
MNASPIPHPLPVTELVDSAGFRQQLVAALRQGFLDEKFFYSLPESVQAWVDLCRSTEYRNANRALSLLDRIAPRLPELWPATSALISLGCGEGSKDVPLLDAFARRGAPILYIGADFSRPLLELALETAAPVAREISGYTADLLDDRHLERLTESHGNDARIFAVLGNTLGAFGPAEFPRRLRRLLRSTDRVLFDGELWAGEETLRGYDNPVNRRFAFSPLAALGIGERDGELRFQLRPGPHGLHAVAKDFVPARDLTLSIDGQRVVLPAGQSLRMSSSLKYDEPALLDCIQRAGFRVEFSEKSDDGRFLLAGARPQ